MPPSAQQTTLSDPELRPILYPGSEAEILKLSFLRLFRIGEIGSYKTEY